MGETPAKDLDLLDGWKSADAFFGPARIDADERRLQPAPHRYVHGFFEGTETRFAIYLPDAFEGRLLQFLQGGRGGSEFAGVAHIKTAFRSGAAFVESNQGHTGAMKGVRGNVSVMDHRASQQTALFATELIAAHYGAAPRYRYLLGGSGGGLRAIACAENAPGVWDGVLPYILNRNGLMNWNFSILVWAALALADRLDDIVDATDAGGSGDPFATLDAEQREALAALYRAGYCRGAESQITPSPLWVLGLQIVRSLDRTYYPEFWTERGYEGLHGTPLLRRLRRRGVTRVAGIRTAGEVRGRSADEVFTALLGGLPEDAPVAIELAGVDPVPMLGTTFRVTSGAAAGQSFDSTGDIGGGVTAFLNTDAFRELAMGDELEFDNGDLLAFAYHHRHFIDPRYPEMASFLVDSLPLHRQRAKGFNRIDAPTGRFNGKMIIVQNSADKECWPSCARAYVESVASVLANDLDDRFRIWWTQNSPHVPPSGAAATRLVGYEGMYNQALLDLISWVEDDVPPPPSTQYAFNSDNAIVYPSTAAERGGIQPVVTATANGHARAEVAAGEVVSLVAHAEVPPCAGAVIALDWDLDGTGLFATPGANGAVLKHAWSECGVHFATARARSHRTGDAADPPRTISNLCRVRVVVH